MARSRRSRRGRSRNRRAGLVFSEWLLVLLGVLILLTLGITLQSRGVFTRFVGSSDESVGGVSSNRLRGSDGIDIPVASTPDWWWTRVVIDEVLAPTKAISTIGSERFSRVLIPTDVLFGQDSAVVTQSAKNALHEVSAAISSPDLKVIVVCHAARGTGNPADRKPLSEKRAQVVAAMIEDLLGRSPGSIERIGMGDEQPLAGIDQSNDSGRALNRRCEIFVEIGD